MAVDWDSVVDLGLVPDTHLAARFGVLPSTVCIARNRRGIPPAPIDTRDAGGRIAWDDVLDLGIASDREIADRLGCPIGNVAQARRKRALPAAWRDRTAERKIARTMRRRGVTLDDIASVLEVHRSTACKWTMLR